MVDDGGEKTGTDEAEEEGVAKSETGEDGVAKSTPGLEQRIKRLSLGAILGSAAAILVVGLVVGLAAGYQIEKTRVKSDVDAANARAGKSATAPAKGQAQTTPTQLRGTVATAAADKVGVTVKGATKELLTDQATVVVKATPGSPTDIAAGGRVVWKAKKGQSTQADAVIVLPADAKVGTTVVSATATSMTLKHSPKNVTVNTSGATVEKVTTAKVTDITPGAKVIAQARQTNQALHALEIIVLPSANKFVA